MMAESLPFSMGSTAHSWEMEDWYEDLEEVLSLDITGGTDLSTLWGQELEELDLDDTALLWGMDASEPLEPNGNSAAKNWDLSPPFPADPLELSPDPSATPESGSSSPPQTGTDEEASSALVGQKRKRNGQPHGSKRQRGREQQRRDEERAAELTAENEHLRREIERLTAEVEATRKALIQHMVNLKN